ATVSPAPGYVPGRRILQACADAFAWPRGRLRWRVRDSRSRRTGRASRQLYGDGGLDACVNVGDIVAGSVDAGWERPPPASTIPATVAQLALYLISPNSL